MVLVKQVGFSCFLDAENSNRTVLAVIRQSMTGDREAFVTKAVVCVWHRAQSNVVVRTQLSTPDIRNQTSGDGRPRSTPAPS